MPTQFTIPGFEVSETFFIGTYEMRFDLSVRLCDSSGFYYIYARLNGYCPDNSQLGTGTEFNSRVGHDEPIYFPGGLGPLTLNTSAGRSGNPLP
jgi:hypothetical protein